jgi:regulator of protease activity HflC (stomatin/prohibitin superfamily)
MEVIMIELIVVAGVLGTLALAAAKSSWVPGHADAFTLVVRDGQLVRGGIGASGFVWPTDEVLRFPASVQRVRFATDFVDREGLRLRLEAFALWSVDGGRALEAYQRLGLAAGMQHGSGHLLSRAQHHAFQQAFAALVQRHGGGFGYRELVTDPAPLLARLHDDARQQLDGLAVVVEDVQLLTLTLLDDHVAKALAEPAAQEAQRLAEEARGRSEAAAQRDRLARQVAHQQAKAKLTALEEAARQTALDAELARARQRAEAELEHGRLVLQLAQEKGPELRAHELAVLRATSGAEALASVGEARLVHVGGTLPDLLERLLVH